MYVVVDYFNQNFKHQLMHLWKQQEVQNIIVMFTEQNYITSKSITNS